MVEPVGGFVSDAVAEEEESGVDNLWGDESFVFGEDELWFQVMIILIHDDKDGDDHSNSCDGKDCHNDDDVVVVDVPMTTSVTH